MSLSNWLRLLLGLNTKESSIRRSRSRPSRRPPHRPFLETLEDRLAPATNITVISGAAGAGNLDQFLSATNGTVTTANDAGDTAATLSVGALQGVGAGVNIHIEADTAITFNDISSLSLQTAAGSSAAFVADAGAITFNNTANTVTTAGGALTFQAGTNLAPGIVNSGGGDITLTTGAGATFAAASTQGDAIASDGGNITISADSMAISGGIDTGGTSGIVTLQQASTTLRQIELGSVGAIALGITDSELNEITTGGILRIGRTDNGGLIEIAAPITAHAGFNTLDLRTGSDVVEDTTGSVAVTSLAVQATGTTFQNDNSSLFANPSAVSNLAVNAAGEFGLFDSVSLTITTVDGVVGFAGGGGGVNSSAANTSLTVNEPVSVDNGIGFVFDNMTLNAPLNVGSSGDVELQPFTTGQLVNIGGANAPGTLGLAASELDNITAGLLFIGAFDDFLSLRFEVSAGTITVSAPITLPNVTTLELQTGDSITEPTAADGITVANLNISTANADDLDANNDVTTGVLTADVANAGQGFTFVDVNGLTIGSAQGQNGIDTNGGTIAVTAENGNLTINNGANVANKGVNAGAATIDLAANGAESLFTNSAPITNSGGNEITVATDRMALGGGTITAAGGGTVALEATAAGRPINLGPTADPTGSLNLSNAELNTITTTGVLQIGDSTAGDITLSTSITLTNVPVLLLQTGGGVSQGINNPLSVANLAIEAVNAVTMNSGSVSSTVAANVAGAGQGFEFLNGANMTVGTVAGLQGITTNDAFIGIQTTGNLTVNSNIAGAFDVSLTADGANSVFTNNAAILNAGGGIGPATFIAADIQKLDGSPGTSTITSANGAAVILDCLTAGNPVNLGTTAKNDNELDLSDADLNTITTTGVVQIGSIGRNSRGTATISAPLSLPRIGTLLLNIGAGGIVQASAADTLSVAALAFSTSNAVSLLGANNVTDLAGIVSGAGEGVTFNDAAPLDVTIADGEDGITTNGGAITVSTTDSDLTLGGPVTAGTGAVSLTAGGAESTFTNSALVNPFIANTVGGSSIVIVADRMALLGVPGASPITAANGGRVTLDATSGNRPINLGPTTDPTGSLNLSNAELNIVNTTGVLQIGDSTNGNITVSAAIALTHVPVIELVTGGGVSESAGGTVTVANLAVDAVNGVTMTDANELTGALAGNVAASGQSFSFTSSGPVTIGTADGLSGITTNGGAIAVNTTAGNLTVNQNVRAGAAIITLTAGGSGTVTETGTGAVAATNLDVQAPGGVAMSMNASTVSGRLAGSSAGKAFSFTNTGAITVGSVDGQNGITTSGGAVTVTANTGTLTINQPITAGNAPITLTADSLAINAAVSAGTNAVILAPATANRTIDLGHATAGALGLTSAELNLFSAAFVDIGTALTTGTIQVTAAITAGTHFNGLSLTTGGSVVEDSGGSLQVHQLDMQAAAGIGSTASPLQIAVSGFFADTTNNSGIALAATGSASITGTPTGGGLSAGTGTITLSAGTFNLTANNQINAASKLTVGAATLNLGAFGNTVKLLTLSAKSVLAATLSGPHAGQSGNLTVNGLVTLGNATLKLTLGAGFTLPPTNSTITLIHNNGHALIVGQFAGIANNAVIVVGGHKFRLSYLGGTSRIDVTLTSLD